MWNEKAMLKADMMNVPARWATVSLAALKTKCLAVGLSDKDTATILDLVRRVQDGRRLVPQRGYREFRFQSNPEPPTNRHYGPASQDWW